MTADIVSLAAAIWFIGVTVNLARGFRTLPALLWPVAIPFAWILNRVSG